MLLESTHRSRGAMNERVLFLSIPVVLLLAACTATTGSASSISTSGTPASTSPGAQCPTDGEPFETAKLYIEHNATDSDTGVHGLFGGEAWSELCIWNPAGELIMVVDPVGPLGDLRVADLFFESREPRNDDVSVAALLESFPEGEYAVAGTDFEGTPRRATAKFTHAIPAEPVITSPELGEDEEHGADVLVGKEDLVVAWEPVTETLDGAAVEITGYEVIITKVDHDDPNGWSRPVYDVHVGPGSGTLSVPAEFFDSGALYELEVLALEVSGNQTIGLGFFTIG